VSPSLTTPDRLLSEAAREKDDRVRRHLLVAAALTAAFAELPIVVGGVAEDWWAAGVYKETDLDLCVPIGSKEIASMRELGFRREGRHWYHAATNVAVEFPDSRIDGDPERARSIPVGGGHAVVIGLDDLYLDRLRQATANEGTENDIAFQGALAVAAARYEEMDWRYVKSRIEEITRGDRMVGEAMKRIDRLLRRRARIAAAGS
jgi:hypothetical protein